MPQSLNARVKLEGCMSRAFNAIESLPEKEKEVDQWRKAGRRFEEAKRRFDQTSRPFDETRRRFRETGEFLRQVCERADNLVSEIGELLRERRIS